MNKNVHLYSAAFVIDGNSSKRIFLKAKKKFIDQQMI
jgi:hypothetical protein